MSEIEFALNTLYMVLSGALVMWMAAGFITLEAGFVRTKNVSEVVTKNLGLYAIACTMYLICGFALMYPGDNVINSYLPQIGTTWNLSLDQLTFNGGLGYSDAADFFFQVVFVATTMSIISGAVAERMRLVPFYTFCVFLTGFIYPIQGYWKWGGGFLDQLGYADFAGSGVVHLCGASAALAAIIVLGPRIGKHNPDGTTNAIQASNIPLVAVAGFILLLGWFGFNGGSQLAIHDVLNANAVAQIFLNTNAAAAGGILGALLFSYFRTGKFDVTMAVNGAISGLVAITAGPDTPSGGAATLIGLFGGVIGCYSIIFLDKVLKLDDCVGAISAHGSAGIWGIMVVPLTNPGATYLAQAIGVLSIFLWSFVLSYIVCIILKNTIGLRASATEEEVGLDESEVGVPSYPEFVKS